MLSGIVFVFIITFYIDCMFLYHVTCTFQSKSTLCSYLNIKELLAWSRHNIWSLSDCNATATHNHLVCKWTINHLAKLATAELCYEYLSVQCIWLYVLSMSCTCFRVSPHLYSCLNVKERLDQNRHDIWSLSDWNRTRIHNHSVCKQTLNHLAKLGKWLSCIVSTYLFGTLDCMLQSFFVLLAFHSPNFTASQLFPLFILIISPCNVIHLKFWESFNSTFAI